MTFFHNNHNWYKTLINYNFDPIMKTEEVTYHILIELFCRTSRDFRVSYVPTCTNNYQQIYNLKWNRSCGISHSTEYATKDKLIHTAMYIQQTCEFFVTLITFYRYNWKSIEHSMKHWTESTELHLAACIMLKTHYKLVTPLSIWKVPFKH